MAKIERFEDLEIWQEAARIGIRIYHLVRKDKLKYDFSSNDQLKRAALSVSNNIAEGFEYNNNKAFQRFLFYAKGSAGELRSQLYVLKGAGVLEEKDYNELHEELILLSKRISAFKKYLSEFEKAKKTK